MADDLDEYYLCLEIEDNDCYRWKKDLLTNDSHSIYLATKCDDSLYKIKSCISYNGYRDKFHELKEDDMVRIDLKGS